MRSIRARFKYFQTQYPNLGDFLVLSKAVRGQGFSTRAITHWFQKLIDKSDYSRKDAEELILHLAKSIKQAEEGIKQG